MARPRKYEDARKFDRQVEKYFESITRLKTVTEKKDSGERDGFGHIIWTEVPVVNRLGKEVQVIEYLVPPTIADLCEWLHIDGATWARYANPDKHPEFCETITRARGRIQNWNEHELLTREGKDLKGIIFNLENNFGYAARAQVEMSGSIEQYLQAMEEQGGGQEF